MSLDFHPLSALCAGDCQRLLTVLSLASALMLLVSALALPWFLARLPADFFRRPLPPRTATPVALLRRLVRNALALLLLLAGVAMLVLPGQGLLCIVIALALSDVPGKRRLLRQLVSSPRVVAALNWIRKTRGKPPFEL